MNPIEHLPQHHETAPVYYGILTDLGQALLADAIANGTPLPLTHMAVGDGAGLPVTPLPEMTALVNEVHRAPLNQLFVDPTAANQIVAEMVMTETTGGFWIRELGLYDETGALFAIANAPDSYKPLLEQGAGRALLTRMVLIVSDTAAVELIINPDTVMASRAYVDAKIAEHAASRDHPAAIEGAQGMIPLATQAMVDAGTDHASAVTPQTAGVTFAKQQHEHEMDDILWLQEAFDEKLNKAGDTATGNLTAPKFIMNAAQGTGAGDAVRYDYLLGAIPKRGILVSGHLDYYTTPGFHFQSATAPDPSGNLGYPVNKPGALLVLSNGGGLTQMYIVNPTTSTSTRAIYYRNYWTGSWSVTWTKLYDTNNKPTPADIGAAPVVHGHQVADVSGLQGALDGKSPIGHTHAPGDVGAAPIDHVHTAAQGNSDIVAGGYGQVGTYVLAWNSDGQSVFIGNTKPGSSLIPATAGERREDGHFLSGTYKCLGHVFGGGNSDDATTLWIRTDAASLFEQQLMLSELGWDNAEHDSATAIATFADSGVSLPFTAFKDDIEAHGRWLFAMIRDGEFGPVAEYIPPTALEVAARDSPKTRQQALADAIAQARHCEMMCDWDKAQEWRTYYQQLYTLEDAPEWPQVAQWPAPPTESAA